MALKFKGKDIPGSHGSLVWTTEEPHLRIAKYWDLRGEVAISGRTGGRSVQTWIILHDSWTKDKPDDLLNFIQGDLGNLVGRLGTLEESGTVRQTLDDCVFLGFEPIPLPGQPEPGPLRDMAGVLDAGEYGWFMHGILRWRQLLP